MNDLLDPEELKKQMIEPPKTKLEVLQSIVDKGIDQELLQELKTKTIYERLARLESENENRSLESTALSIQLYKFATKIGPMLSKIYKHFFEPEVTP